MSIRAIASDYDGTLAENDVVPASTVAALARFKASGRTLILVTGRHLPDLKEVFGSLLLFDLVVVENGGLLYFPGSGEVRPLAAPPSEAFVASLRRRGPAASSMHRSPTARRAPSPSMARPIPGGCFISPAASVMIKSCSA